MVPRHVVRSIDGEEVGTGEDDDTFGSPVPSLGTPSLGQVRLVIVLDCSSNRVQYFGCVMHIF